MPFLRANGWTLPVSAEGATRPPPEAVGGGRGLMQDGTERNGSAVTREGVGGTTRNLSPAEAAAARGWLLAESDQYPLSADLSSAAGQSQAAGYVASLRPRLGKYGTASGTVSVEVGTTNLVPLANQKFVGWTPFDGATITLTQGQAIPGVTTNGATRIQTSGGAGNRKYNFTGAAGVIGTALSIGMWIYNIGSQTVSVRGTQVSAVNVLPGEIAWAAGSGTISTTAREIYLQGATAAAVLDFIAFEPQMEEKTFATAFASSPRPDGALAMPSLGTASEGTVAFWYNPRQPATTIVSEGTSPSVAAWNGFQAASSWRLWGYVSFGAQPTLTLFVRGASTTAGWSASLAVATTGWYAPGTWVHIAVTWTRGVEFRVYVNGALGATTTIGDAMTGVGSNPPLSLGTPSASAPGNGWYNEAVTAGYAMTAGQVAALYARTATLPVPPLLECDGDVLFGRTVAMTVTVEETALVMGAPSIGLREQVGFRLRRA